jgi:hypothetical protein
MSTIRTYDAASRVDTDELSEAMLPLADDSRMDASTGGAAQGSAPSSVRAMDKNGASGVIMSDR